MGKTSTTNHSALDQACEESSQSESAAAIQFKASLDGLSYDDQVKALQPDLPVQFNVAVPERDSSASDIKATAAEGVSSSGGQLPHLDAIQNSFGPHDVSSVQAHVGGAAAKASTAMGAEAYATGNDVAFKSAPDLHTAAHEAAHVVQQRSGVSLDNGVGKAGDSYERNADAVADAVVSGQSAAGLLGGAQGGRGEGLQKKDVQFTGTAAASGSSSSGSSSGGAASGSSSGGASSGPSPEALAARLPQVSYTRADGTVVPLTFKLVGDGGQIQEGTRPLIGQTDSLNPITISREIERMTARYITGDKQDDAAFLQTIVTRMADLRVAMSKARGEDIAMVQLRTTFEKDIGAMAYAGGPGNFARAGTAITNMCTAAVNMIGTSQGATIPAAQKIDETLNQLGGNPEFQAALTSTGIDLTKGYAGAVGTGFDQVKAAFTSGSLTDKAVHLINFGDKFILPKVLEGHASVLSTIATNIGPAEYEKFLARADLAAAAPAHAARKKLFQEAEKVAFEAAKGDRGMDTKTAYEPVENLDERALIFLAGNKGVDVSACRSKQDLVTAVKAAGYTYSGNLAHGQDLGGSSGGGAAGSLTASGTVYLQGIRDNIVDPSHNWISEATNVLQMPLKAGISGTTHRFLSLAALLGSPGSDARLAMLGHLQQIEAHSFHEICVAGAGYPNCEYVAGKYVPFSPITPQQMESAAIETIKKDPEFGAAVTGTEDRKLQAKRLLNAE